MSSTQTAAELRRILTHYCHSYLTKCPDIERLKNLLSKVSNDQKNKLLTSTRDSNGDTVLTRAAYNGQLELCVTVLSSLPPADRLKLILEDKFTALHLAAWLGYTETVSGILSCLTAEQQLQLLFTQSNAGNTALHDAALQGHTETVKTLLDNLTPEQQLQLLFTQDSDGDTALHYAARKGHTETVKTMLHNLTPEQQLQILSVQNKKGMTASEEAAGRYTNSETMGTL